MSNLFSKKNKKKPRKRRILPRVLKKNYLTIEKAQSERELSLAPMMTTVSPEEQFSLIQVSASGRDAK
jgi:hypothetical protein